MKVSYLLLSLCLLAISVNATSSSLTTFLRSYNISYSAINSITSVNMTYNSHSYTELFLNSKPYLLVNVSTTGSPSFVFNTASIASIISNNTIAMKLNTLNLLTLRAELGAYLNSSAGPLYGAFGTVDNCLADTGLNAPGATCTFANGCDACAHVTACSCAAGLACPNPVLASEAPPPDSGVQGVINFETNYTELNNNIEIFYNSTTNVSTSNLNSKIVQLNSVFFNISHITQTIQNNTVFPPPPAAFSGACVLTSLGAHRPSYCSDLGICPSLTYNYTKLAVLQGLINTINSDEPTTAYINSQAQIINKTENNLITPLILGQKAKQLNLILNTTLANYTLVVNESSVLLSHLPNSTLGASLAALKSGYSNLKSNYLTINLSTYSAAIASDLTSVSILYNRETPVYNKILGMAKNNTAILIALQSQSNNPPVSSLAFKEDQLNLQASTTVNSAAAITSNLTSIATQAKALETISLDPSNLAREIDGPFAMMLASALGFSYPAAAASMPLFAVLLSLIIGIIIFGLFYGMYLSLEKHHRIRKNRSTSKAWMTLFLILLVIILIYLGVTYYYAYVANSNAPILLFSNALTASNSIGIVLNGSTTTPGMTSCANILYNESLAAGKKPTLVYVSGTSCSIKGASSTSGACLNSLVKSGTPFIMLTNSNVSEIRAYSMYGTALYAQGNSNFMSYCYPSFFLK